MTRHGSMANRVAAFAAVVTFGVATSAKSLLEEPGPTFGYLSEPEEQQAHGYTKRAKRAPHIARGDGLHAATTGVPTSFHIDLFEDGGRAKWSPGFNQFIYVWIASKDQIFIAEVVDDGGGTLTATYETSFPGDYLVYIEEVKVSRHDEGRPITNSPFPLTVTGAPTLEVDELPLCGGSGGGGGVGAAEDVEQSFWRPGTWVSSRLASAAHGVTRNGWVFQPRSCAHDTFAYDDLMRLASLEEETWLLVLGGSVQRGLFLTLVDMALARGQKDNINRSALQKCWGYANVRIGNLRLTYQDVRLYTIDKVEDLVMCNDEKLLSGSSSEYVRSCKEFLASTVFREGTSWPSAILAPSNIQRRNNDNLAINVPIEALPPTWTGKLLMVDHMGGFGSHWRPKNPTMTSWSDIGLKYQRASFGDDELRQMREWQEGDPRVEFLSLFPMYQAKLFENQNTRDGVRKYGSSVHYHYVSRYGNSTETNGGSRMVQSTMTEMLANIMIGTAVGSKAELRQRVEAAPGDVVSRSRTIGKTFEIEHDCPASLVPYHVKPVPEPTRITVDDIPEDYHKGEVWNKQLCPGWCMAEKPVSKMPTESGLVDVRECSPDVLSR